MDAPLFDVLVIGGGPAGSCAAAFARQRGLSVCLAEKDEFPRFHIGESLLPMGNGILRAAGVWPKIEAAGFMEKFGAQFWLGDGPNVKEIDFADGYVSGLEKTYQVDRSRFDSILLDHARSLGADVRCCTTVRELKEGEGAVTATLAAKDGAERAVTARWVIDAGGRDQLYPSESKKALEPAALPRRAAVYSHFHGVARPSGRRGGNIVVVRIREGWFWLIPLDGEKTSCGLVASVESLRRPGASPAAVFRAAVDASPRLKEVLEGAYPLRPFQVTADYSYFRRELASPRVVLTGDAAGFLDPIFSSGVYLATWSAQKAVAAIARAHEAGRSLSHRERQVYTRQIKAHSNVFRRLIEVFYDEDGFSVFMVQRPPLNLAPGLVSIVAGHARLTWPLWWRYRIFLLICRLQKRFPLVPRIAIAAGLGAGGIPSTPIKPVVGTFA